MTRWEYTRNCEPFVHRYEPGAKTCICGKTEAPVLYVGEPGGVTVEVHEDPGKQPGFLGFSKRINRSEKL